jgi:hypothetical protein
MNRFRKLGFIEYKGRIRVHKSLLNVILHDQLPERRATKRSVREDFSESEEFSDSGSVEDVISLRSISR